ncbi:MAG: Na/Pi symporter [Minisyncoccia bacterium]
MLGISGIIVGIIGSVALFLYSVISFSNIIKHTAGQKIRNLLSSLTSNSVKGVIFGTVSTAILQSSSATSVLVASLADAGLISFYSTLGVIFGVNIGTTITSQLVAFNAMSVSPFIILLGLIVYWWGNSFKRYGKPIIYFGLLFFSIYLISIFVSHIDQGLLGSYLSITSNPIIAIMIGIIASAVFQSSSIVSGIVLILAGAGHIDLAQSVGLILGANIGTTSTVIIASLAMGREAKKVALSHFLFNFLGVIILLPFLVYFYRIVQWLDGDLVHQVANIHLIFNLICAFVFLLAIKPFYFLINRIIR